MRKNIYDLSFHELLEYFLALQEPKFRAAQVFSELHKGTALNNITNISKALKGKLNSDFYCELPEIIEEHKSKDGTLKFLMKLQDQNLIECVLLTQAYGKTICVSSQVGCKMRCSFCASGEDGFVRNLTAGEILGQVLLLNSRDKITNIVIMGSGEPLDNFDEVVKFLKLVTCADGINISARSVSLSTVGLPDKIREFADLKLQVNLCLSLHASNDKVRNEIMPVSKKYKIKDVLDACKYFFDKTHRRVLIEYAMIDDVNCDNAHARELAQLLKQVGFAYHVNLINLNPNGSLKPPSKEIALKFLDNLIKSGAGATMRVSKGSDIAGACGQLKLQRRK